MGPLSSSENALADELLGGLSAGMLCLADRGFYSFERFKNARQTGAQLLWRVQRNMLLPREEQLTDGSYVTRIYANQPDQRAQRDGERVRVVEYQFDDGLSDPEQRYRLLTTILEPDRAPAGELGVLYHERWEIENALDELKVHQRGPRVVLRSKAPDGVYQEAYGYLCTHYAIRTLMHDAARTGDLDPDRLSFTRTLRAARRSTRTQPGFPPLTITAAHEQAITEILAERLGPRRLRSNPRVIKRKMSNWPVKRPEHRDPPKPTKPPTDAITILAA